MHDTADNQADFPQLGSQKPGLGFPIASIVVLISLAAGTVIDYSLAAYQGKGTGETSLLSQLFGSLSLGDLLMADRYYCTFAIIALMQIAWIPLLFQIHARKKSFSVKVYAWAQKIMSQSGQSPSANRCGCSSKPMPICQNRLACVSFR